MSPLRRAQTRQPRIAVIGGGVAGAACARALADAGTDVMLIDKARGLGGRTSTRRGGPVAFNHGAAFFHTAGNRFGSLVEEAVNAGTLARWTGRVRLLNGGQLTEIVGTQERFVAVPGMSAFARYFADGIPTQCGRCAKRIVPEGSGWRLGDAEGADLGLYDAVAVAVPAPQAAPLLAHAPELAAKLTDVRMAPTWTVMAAWDRALELPFEAAYIPAAPLALMVHDGTKPGRGGGESWVLHASTAWSAEHLEDDPGAVVRVLVRSANSAVGRTLPEPSHAVAHRWRYAAVLAPLGTDYLLDPERRIGACGDWGRGSTVEHAVVSGLALAEALIDEMS